MHRFSGGLTSRQLGFTLMELMLALVVSTASVSASLALIKLGQHANQQTGAMSQAAQQTRSLLEWMIRELQESVAESVQIGGDDSSAILFASARNDSKEFTENTDGQPQWQRMIVYYLLPDAEGAHDLYRYETARVNWTARVSLADIIDQRLGEEIGSQISILSFYQQGKKVNIKLRTAIPTDSGVVVTEEISTEILVRNHM